MRSSLRKVILERFGTQAACAEHVGISKQFLSDILAGRKFPGRETAKRLSDATDVDLDIILGVATPEREATS